jgi:hypothetical protein
LPRGTPGKEVSKACAVSDSAAVEVRKPAVIDAAIWLREESRATFSTTRFFYFMIFFRQFDVLVILSVTCSRQNSATASGLLPGLGKSLNKNNLPVINQLSTLETSHENRPPFYLAR